MADIIAHCARRVDFFLQSHLRLRQEVSAPVPGEGAFGAEDWARGRARLTAPARGDEDRYASDVSYRAYLATIHDAKLASVHALLDEFSFARYARILELGCGDMPQAFTVLSRHPGLHYTASDFDPVVIERCARLPMLSGLRKRVLDVTADAPGALAQCDLAVSWSLEFCLDDASLGALFAACREARVPYLLCTHAAIGPLGYLAQARRARLDRRASRPLRTLGWLRSVRELERIARAAGMAPAWKAYHVNHAALLFTPGARCEP